MPSRKPARSRGPPRPTDSRASARDMSGAPLSMVRISSRAAPPATDRDVAARRRPRADRGDGAIDRIEQRAAPFAGERPRQFEIGAGGGVDRHGGAGGLARRRRQRRGLFRRGGAGLGEGGGGGA